MTQHKENTKGWYTIIILDFFTRLFWEI